MAAMEMDPRNSSQKRATNFSRSEENMLISLVTKYAHIIENKKTDSANNNKKTETWLIIEKEFNSACGDTYRSVVVLRNKYLNLKKKSLKKFGEEKKEIYSTGGGPSKISKDNEIDSSIKEIIGSRMTGFTSEFDNDVIVTIDENKLKTMEVTNDADEEEETHIFHCDENTELPQKSQKVAEQSNWSKNPIEILRNPVSSPLSLKTPTDVRKRDNTLRTKLSEWAKAKQDNVTTQQQCILEEHEEKLRHKEELHQQKLLHNQEEHDLKISILKWQEKKLLEELGQ